MAAATDKPANLTLIEGWVSISGNVVLFGLKLWVGLLTGSVALTADAYHTLTDSVSSAIVIFSGWFGRRPADAEHPFGHGRSDLIFAVVIGVLLITLGFEFCLDSVDQLRGGVGVAYGPFAVAVLLISIVTKELMAQFAFWAARRTNSPILRADGWHHRTDALSSVVILIGVGFSARFWWIDGVLGILVSLMIFYAAIEILRDSVDRLIGEQPDDEVIDAVGALIAELGLNVEPHHFHLHRYGDHTELTFHLLMAPELSLKQAHDQAHQLEDELRERLGIEATIHMEPEERHEAH